MTKENATQEMKIDYLAIRAYGIPEMMGKAAADFVADYLQIERKGASGFNDSSVVYFEDPQWIKVVDLDERSRQQQMAEGWFDSIEEVFTQALSLTIPGSKIISYVVPDQRKAEVISNTLNAKCSNYYRLSSLYIKEASEYGSLFRCRFSFRIGGC